MKTAHASQLIYDSLMDTSDCIYLFEASGETDFIIIEVNKAFEKEFGITAAYCVGKRPQDILGYEVATLVNTNLQRCVQLSRTLEGIVEMELPHGKQGYQTTFVPLQNQIGTVNRVLTVKRRVDTSVIDDASLLYAGDYRSSLLIPMHTMKRVMGFTDLNALKTEVDQKEKQVRALAELAPYGILTLKHIQPVFANRSLLKLAGVDSFEEYVKKGSLCFIHPNDRRYIMRLFNHPNAINQFDKQQQTITGVNALGELRQLDIRFVQDETTPSHFTQVIVFDITDSIEKEKSKAQLISLSLSMNQCNENKVRIRKELEHLIRDHNLDAEAFSAVLSALAQHPEERDDLSNFLECFEVSHPDFLIHLKAFCPSLTLNEIKHCACIRMRYHTKDIARLFNIHPASVQKARVRLKKKLGLLQTLDLREWIESI